MLTKDSSSHIFTSTVPQNILIPEMEAAKYFGILDIQPDRIKEPPRFTEPATLEAMTNLGIRSTDLVPKNPEEYAEKDVSIRIQIQIELEKRRLAMIERIITERKHILNIDTGTTKKEETPPPKKTKSKRTKKPKKSKASRATKKSKVSEADSMIPTKPTRQSHLPELIRNKKKRKNSLQELPTNRRIKKKSTIDTRMERAALIKAKYDKERVENAKAALKKMERAEKQQQELRMRQQALIKEKAQRRLNRLAKKEAMVEKSLIKRKEAAKSDMQRQQESYNKIKERERKKYEIEYKKRMKKIYGGQPVSTKKKEHLTSLAEKRKKMIESKLDSQSRSQKANSTISHSKFEEKKTPKQSVSSKKSFATKTRQMAPVSISTLEKHTRYSPIKPAKGSMIPFLRVK